MKNNQGHRDLSSRNKTSNQSLRQWQANFKETTNQSTSLKKNESVDQLDSQKSAYEFDWATHIQITTTKITDPCLNIVSKCQKQMHATIIYMGYQNSANQIVADLNKRSEGLAKLVTSPRQIVEAYQNSNSKTKIFVYWSSDKNFINHIKDNWIPSFIDLVINFSYIEQKNLDSYECRIRRKVMEKQKFKLQGIVVNLFYSERETNSMSVMLMSKKLNSIILKQQQLGNLSSYFKQQARNSVLTYTKSSIELQIKQEKTHSQVLGTATKQQRNVKWAKYFNVSSLDSEIQTSLIKQVVQFNKNQFRCAIIYTKNYDEQLKLTQLLSNLMPIKFVKDPFDLKTKLAELQKSKIRILIISNSYAWYMRQNNVPQNVDLIINSVIPEDSKQLIQRIAKNAFAENKDAQKLRKGVIVSFIENSPSQNNRKRDLLSKFLSENDLEAEQLQTDGMGKDWCKFWGYSKSRQTDVPQQIISEPKPKLESNETTQQHLTQNQVNILAQFDSKNQEKQSNFDLKWATFLQAKLQQSYRIGRCKNYVLTNLSHQHHCVVYVLNQSTAKRIFDIFDQSWQNVTSVIKGNSQSKTTNDYFQKLREGSIKVLIIAVNELSEQWMLPSCVDLIINYGLPTTVQQLERRLRKQRDDQVEYRGVVMNIVNNDQALLLQKFSKKHEIPVDTSYDAVKYDFKHLFSSVKNQQKQRQVKEPAEKSESKTSTRQKNQSQIYTKQTNKVQMEDKSVKNIQNKEKVKTQNKGDIRSSHSSGEEHTGGQLKVNKQDWSQKQVVTIAQDGVKVKSEKEQKTDKKGQPIGNANNVDQANKITQKQQQADLNVQQQTQQGHQSMQQVGKATTDDKQIINNTFNITSSQNRQYGQQPKVQLPQSSNMGEFDKGNVFHKSNTLNLDKKKLQIEGNNSKQSRVGQFDADNGHKKQKAKTGDNNFLQGVRVNEGVEKTDKPNYDTNTNSWSKDTKNTEKNGKKIKNGSNSGKLDQQKQSYDKKQQTNGNQGETTKNQSNVESVNQTLDNGDHAEKLQELGNSQQSCCQNNQNSNIPDQGDRNDPGSSIDIKKAGQQNQQAIQAVKDAQEIKKQQNIVESGLRTQNGTSKIFFNTGAWEQQNRDQKKQSQKKIEQPAQTDVKNEQKQEKQGQKQEPSQQNIKSGLAVQPQLWHQSNLHNLKKQQQNELGAVLTSTLQANNSSMATLIESKLKIELKAQLCAQTDIFCRQIKENKQQVSNNFRQMGQQVKEEIKQTNTNTIKQQKQVVESAQDNIIKQLKQTQTQNTNKIIQESVQLKRSLHQILPKQQQTIKQHTTQIQSSIESSTTRILQETVKLAKSTEKQLENAIVVNQNSNTEKILTASTTSMNTLNSIKAKQDELMAKCENIQNAIINSKRDVMKGQQTAVKNISEQITEKIKGHHDQTAKRMLQQQKVTQQSLNNIKNSQETLTNYVTNIPKSIANAAQNISKDVTQSIKKCQDGLNTLGNIQSQNIQAITNQNKLIRTKIAEETNNMKKNMQDLQQQINVKRNKQIGQQNSKIEQFKVRIKKKQKTQTELQLENEFKELKIKCTENVKQLQKLRQEKAQSVIINTELYETKIKLKEEKAETAKLLKKVAELTNTNNACKQKQDELTSNYIQMQKQLQDQTKKLKEQQQVTAQQRTQIENFSKQITEAKMELANVCQLRIEKTTNKSAKSSIILPSIQKKGAVANIAEKSLSSQVWTLSISHLIKKYLSNDKIAMEKLKPNLQNAAKFVSKNEESISQVKEIKQLMQSLDSVCMNGEKANIFWYLKQVVQKILAESDSLQIYQRQCNRYINQLENAIKSLAENSVITFKKGSECSVALILDQDKKESIANAQIKKICGVVNQFNKICINKMAQLDKANRIIDDLKKANQAQKGIIDSLNKAKKETETKLEESEQNAKQLKSTLQSVRAQLTTKTTEFDTKQNNYLQTNTDLGQKLDKTKKEFQKALIDIEKEKKKGADAAIESQKQLDRVRKNATQAMTKLRTQNTETKKKYDAEIEAARTKYDKDIQEANKKYKDLENKAKTDLEQQQLRLNNEKEQQLKDMKNNHDEEMKKIKQQISVKQKKAKKFEDAVNKQFKQILGQEVQISSDSFEKSLNTFDQQYKQKQGKVLFMPESEMYQHMDQSSKKFIYDNIIRVVPNKKILATKTLFTAKSSDDWNRWRYKILEKPNILVMLTLDNDQQVGGFSQNPYSQTDRRSAGKGYLMSITNKKCYDVKRSCEGKVATYHQYSFIFGNNEFIIKDNMKFSVLIGNRYQHFDVGQDRGRDFVGVDEEGQFKEVQFHQIIFGNQY